MSLKSRQANKLAMFFEKMDNNRVHCLLCPQDCRIEADGYGVCRARRNLDGELVSLNYGLVSSLALDPIEKKPLKHFYPGSTILSAGTFGCNLKCSFCQNWSISQKEPELYEITPERLVNLAIQAKEDRCIGIAFTYNEPSIWYEFIHETLPLAKGKGLKNVLVTNGFIRPDPFSALLPGLDAVNIDVKGYTEEFYKKICKGKLEDVKKTVEAAAGQCHVEITTLVIPELNDSVEEIDRLAGWLASLDPEIPLHLSRFFPNYQMRDKEPTPRETLIRLKEIAGRHLKRVYLGNI